MEYVLVASKDKTHDLSVDYGETVLAGSGSDIYVQLSLKAARLLVEFSLEHS